MTRRFIIHLLALFRKFVTWLMERNAMLQGLIWHNTGKFGVAQCNAMTRQLRMTRGENSSAKPM